MANNGDARARALQQMEKIERRSKLAFAATAVVEVLLLTVLVLLTDFSNRLHLLLLAGFVGSYSVILLALVALGGHVSKIGLRIVRALEADQQ